MSISYSIAEAETDFAGLLDAVEKSAEPIAVTRHGLPVAVLLSPEVYERLTTARPPRDFWAVYLAYQKQWQDIPMDIEEDIWADVRDKSPGREIDLWES
jgi:prevent-host-death family protein